MTIPFFKAHGAGNDFLFTFARDLPAALSAAEKLPQVARAICHRFTGVGADGWYLIEQPAAEGAHARVRLWNQDGSYAELSGNGSRCVCAILVDEGLVDSDEVRLLTGAGLRTARLIRRDADGYWFEQRMGTPVVRDVSAALPLPSGVRDVTVVDVGNPQCAVPVAEFPADWEALGAAIETHARFAPANTNVSFVRAVDAHTIEARFWERGAHHTLSSGTGSVGAAVAAVARGMVSSPVTVRTEFCPLEVRWEPGGEAYLTGPARIVARGQFRP